MRIFQIVANRFYNLNQVQHPNKTASNPSIIMTKPIPYDTVSFTSSRASGTPLRRLAEYGMQDMYTGKRMLSHGMLSKLLKNNVYEFNIGKLVSILSKYEDTLQDTELKVFGLLKKKSKQNPHIKIDQALKQMYSEHEPKLITVQRSVMYDIILKASELLKEGRMTQLSFDDLMSLIRYSNKKLEKGVTTAHFSEKEFIYRLQQVAKQIKLKKHHAENVAISKIIRVARTMFAPQIAEKRKFGRSFEAKKLKMEYQMQPEILARNTQIMKHLRNLLEQTPLRNHKDILNIFNVTDAKVCGSPTVEPFKRSEFIYDLKTILKSLNDSELEAEIIAKAREIPQATEDVSAFIVKYADDTPERIVTSLLKGSLASIEHIDPRVQQVKDNNIHVKKKKKHRKKKNSASGNRNHLKNYGLASAYINSLRSNMPFDEWVRRHPMIYKNCQKSVDRLIELYHAGVFDVVGLEKDYIYNFAEQVKKLSPKEKPIILDLSKLN